MEKENGGLLPSKEEIKKSINSFNGWQMIAFFIFVIAGAISIFLILDKINNRFLIERPLTGGSFVEGVIGSPRFINPVLASSQTDKDLSALVFSGLMKKGMNGEMEDDLAEKHEVSEDRKVYTFTLRDNALFHDGTRVTADDIVFTIINIQDGSLKSPSQAQWENISVKKIDEKTIEFKLPEISGTFLENTSIGILPSHLWNDLDSDDFIFSDSNIYAVGSGPYQIDKVNKKKNGLIESISVKPFKKYYSNTPYISNIKFNFYKNEDEVLAALHKKKIDQVNAINPSYAKSLEGSDGHTVSSVNLPRVFGLFLNPNKQDIFRNKNIVQSIDLAINKERIVTDTLNGYGKTIDGPIPERLYKKELSQDKTVEEKIAEANSVLERDGWKMNENGIRVKEGKTLSFSISTGDAYELKSVAEYIKEDLQKVGILVEIKAFEITSLNQNIIRPRDYESLFFGQIVNSESDLFAFWHSSQRNDPGLNIAGYTNSKVDGLLDKVSSEKDAEEKLKLLKQIDEEITKDMPAIFLYSPDFIYVTGGKIKNIAIENVTFPSDRLSNISDWYIRTEKIWEFLIK